ncbi:hypothetical protein WNY58_06370 [Neptuniibacter pectenicola]|uniref:Uncharacterized protein n=1 Tax=Neptuniibacter pectenicola TaxID=1806669 RepID=A0ABU9TR72_9GAMM|nr:hypothetical protein [Neptuniibacter pectenicola]
MKPFKSMLRTSVLSLVVMGLTACNAAGVKTDPANETAVDSTQSSDTAKPNSKKPAESSVLGANASEKIDVVGNRLTAVQDHLLQIKSQAAQLQQQNQALSLQLQSLKTDLQGAFTAQPEQAAVQQATPDSFNGVLDQITMMANELSSQVQDGSFRITSAYTGKEEWILIRYHRYTGEAWLADQGKWNLLEESSATGTAEYEVVLLRADGDAKGYVAARINRITGEAWWLKENMWQPYVVEY